ncbi:hypothetical protein M9H77_17695 [Catharanthus roseus]|uniref:Uncharacterized protein n=1 Tax=Catharanthus roseus TaxID=4058 RepID=A0ACC0B5D1_CATRO|nr:hypothetical protein M9H77_17695 [Catharanthus roseus]
MEKSFVEECGYMSPFLDTSGKHHEDLDLLKQVRDRWEIFSSCGFLHKEKIWSFLWEDILRNSPKEHPNLGLDHELMKTIPKLRHAKEVSDSIFSTATLIKINEF